MDQRPEEGLYSTVPIRKPSEKLPVEYQPIAALKSNPKNQRALRDKQIRQIAKSIKTFGFNVPILVDGNLQVVVGHGRLQAAKRAGLIEVPVIRLEHLCEHQMVAFMVADNRLTENS